MYLGGAKAAARQDEVPAGLADAANKEITRPEAEVREDRPAISPSARWQNFPLSWLSHHGDGCCEVARQWIVAMDFAQLNGDGPHS